MSVHDIVTVRRNVESVVDKYQDIIGVESESLIQELLIETPQVYEDTLNNLENENRLLKIGIIGRVKAGKSSLLNALLFKGNTVLPKAATPMTAALTVLSYGDNLSADVEFYSREDIERIKREHSKYIDEFQTKVEQEIAEAKKKKNDDKKNGSELRQKAERKARRALNEKVALSSAYQQYELMKKSGISADQMSGNQSLSADNYEDLNRKLLEYVGSSGKFMPFTKSVHMKLPQDNLRNVEIIDTPGLNDPVQSRENRTRELLKYCDVIIIVSPSGHFLSSDDIELMDRITIKEGVRKLILVASQVDTQLMGDLKEKCNGDMHQVLKGIRDELGRHMSETLRNLKKNSPEVGNTFDQLIEKEGRNILHTSGVCKTLVTSFSTKRQLDDGAQKVWENLTLNYPDYFSENDASQSIASLESLANIRAVETVIDDVKRIKVEILNSRRNDFLEAKSKCLSEYREKLVQRADEQVFKIKHSDAEELRTTKEKIEKTKNKASGAINEEYHDQVSEFIIEMKSSLSNILKQLFKEVSTEAKNAEGSKTERWQTGWWLFKKLHHKEVVTVRAGAVRGAIENMVADVEDTISTETRKFVLDWRKQLVSRLTKALRDCVDDSELDPQLIRKTIRTVMNSVEYPETNYDPLFKSEESENAQNPHISFFRLTNTKDIINSTGTLSGSEAERFIDSIQKMLSYFRRKVSDDINVYISNLESALKTLVPSEKIFAHYRLRIEELENQIQYKKITLDKFQRLITELKGLNI